MSGMASPDAVAPMSLADLISEIRAAAAPDRLLTHEEAGAVLGIHASRVRAIRHQLAASGARYVILPSDRKKPGSEAGWRWSRNSLLELARATVEQSGIARGRKPRG